MKNYTISKQLIKNTKNFLDIKYYSIIDRLLGKSGVFYGWGRKKSGIKAIELSKKDNSSFLLLEDGFIRSMGLGVDKSPTFSIVEDDIGIYYDATTSSKLENILNNYDFKSDENLISEAKKAIALIKTHHISKYNNAIDIKEDYFDDENEKRVLIIAQTAGDSSLKYGMLDDFTTEDMIKDALLENIDSGIYLKVHPDVLSGKKSSDIDIKSLDKRVKVITENLNPISLLKKFDKVYTKTSGMGMEALIVGCKCVCYGMPYYAGWGITIDKSKCKRGKRVLSVEEVFAGAYILYTKYYNPYKNRVSDIFDTINEILLQKKKTIDSKNNILVIGDSHVAPFKSKIFKYILKYNFIINYVPGATARGIGNNNSLTRSHKIFQESLDKYNYDKIIISLGEVDTAYSIWKIHETKNTDIEVILEQSIKKYIDYLHYLTSYAQVIVLSAPYATVKDNTKCDDTISGIRASVNASQKQRIEIGIKFNQKIKEFCNKQKDIKFVDFNNIVLDKNSMLKDIFLKKYNPCDHHYCKVKYSLLILYIFIKKKIL